MCLSIEYGLYSPIDTPATIGGLMVIQMVSKSRSGKDATDLNSVRGGGQILFTPLF